VILSVFSAVLLAFGTQQSGEPFTVAAANAAVATDHVDRVREQVKAGLRQLAATFPGLPSSPIHLLVHADASSLPDYARAGHHDEAPGLALLSRHEIHILWREMLQSAHSDLHDVVVHELTHVLLQQYAAPNGGALPRWFHEGLAQTLAGDTYLGDSEESLIWRATGHRLLPFDELVTDFPHGEAEVRLAYAQSQSYVSWLVREFGVNRVLAVVKDLDGDRTFLQSMVRVLGRPTVVLQDSWLDYLMNRSGARFRTLLSECFSLSLVLALPLLALALIRRLATDRRARDRMEQQERLEQQTAPPPPAEHRDAGARPPDGENDAPPSAPSW